MIIEIIAVIEQRLMEFFIPEIVFWVFVERYETGFKFRFSKIADYPGLKPFANQWTVGIVALLIYLLSEPIFELLLGTTVRYWLISLGFLRLVLLTISLGLFNLIYIVNYIFGKGLDVNTAIFGGISIICFLLFLLT